jgi:hypothetical protein
VRPRAALRIDWAVFVTEARAPAPPPMPVASTPSWLDGPVQLTDGTSLARRDLPGRRERHHVCPRGA